MTRRSGVKRSREAQAHVTSVEMSVAEVAAFLQDNLGQRLVAHMTDTKDYRQAGRWAAGEHAPRSRAEAKLRAALQVFKFLQEAESPHVIRAWFAGMNPHLDDRPPVDVLRDGELRDVMAAARAFRSGGLTNQQRAIRPTTSGGSHVVTLRSGRARSTRQMRASNPPATASMGHSSAHSTSTELEGCFAETLAHFRPAAQLRALLDADAEEQHLLRAGGIARDWHSRRTIVRARIGGDLPLLDLTAPATWDYLTPSSPRASPPWVWSTLTSMRCEAGIDGCHASSRTGLDRPWVLTAMRSMTTSAMRPRSATGRTGRCSTTHLSPSSSVLRS